MLLDGERTGDDRRWVTALLIADASPARGFGFQDPHVVDEAGASMEQHERPSFAVDANRVEHSIAGHCAILNLEFGRVVGSEHPPRTSSSLTSGRRWKSLDDWRLR